MVEEEKYLTLQMENRRLKQEAVERDGKFKQTLARLARAEEAAKRATLASSSNRGAAGGGRIQGTPTTARLFAAEQRATELEEEARELTRKLQREHERGLHFKNLCKEYKVKLDEALKSARSRQPTMRPPGESLAASLAAKQGKSSPTKDDPGASDQLRQERARTAALAKERDELRRLLHAAGGQVPGLSIGGASVALSKRDGSEWVLEHFVHNQQPYLLDRATLKVYSAPTSEKEWPEPVGRLVGGRLHVPTKHEDLFKALDTYLKREQIHLKAAYDRFDADHSGELDTSELGRLLHEVMPGVKHAQQRYFRTMLDINNDGKVTYAEMVESLKECIAVGEKAGAGGGSVELNDILVKLKDYISTKNSTVHVIFNEFDKDSNGSLEQRELVAMFSKLVPNLTPKEKRFLLAHIAKLDLDGDGKISLAELRKALRAVTLSLVEPDGSKATRSSASNVQVGAGRLVLQEYVVHGKMFLLDPKKAYVYNMLSTPDEWLRPLGKVANGVIVAPATSRDLVETLDATLKKQQARLKDFFDAFDSDKSGSLQISELSALLQKLMPGAAAADLRFFQILLDSDGDGHITYQELVTCIKNIISASQASSERGNMDVERALQKLKNLVRNNLGDLRKTFDTSAGGKLTYVQLLGLLRQLMPGSSPQERRYITAFLRQLDLDNSGAVSYEELAYALRVLEVVIVSADGSTPSTSVPQHRRGGASEWYLEDVSLNGHSYLLDRHTLRVYTPTTGAGQWPQLAGRLQGGRLITFERTQEQRFIQGLDTYLKSQQSRLKDVFDTFDRDRGGSLNRNEVAAMLRALMPDASAGDVQYFRMLLDIDGDGEVTFNEFVNGIKDAIAASNTTVHGQTAGGSPELAAVLKILKDFVTSNGISLAQAFDQFDQGKTGYLTHSDLLGMLHTLVPNLTAAERKHVVHHLRALDADGDGRITLAELYQAFRMAEVKRGKPEPPQAARAPAPPPPQQVWGAPQHTSYGGGGGGVSVDAAEMANLREAASEVTYLRQQLRDTKALCAELEGALTRERDTALPQYPFPDGGDGGETTFTAGELQGEIKSAWERAGILQKRYHEAQAALGTMKANHTRVLQQLDDTHKRLNQERKENLKLAAEEKRLAMELEAARELEPMLEQARQERLALEKENHQLLAAAMNAPTEAQSEARRLRSMMMEAQRERSAAELRESDLKRTVQLLGGGGVEDAKVVRMERDRLRADVSRMEVELEASHDKIRVFMEMGHNARLAGTVGRHADMAPSDANMDEGTLRAELRGLRETYSDQVEELRKAQKLLRLEEAQVEDLRAALSEEKARAGKLKEDLYRKVQAHENELDRRQKKIHKLEAQLRRLLSGGSIIEPSEPKTMRASRDGTTRFGGSDEDDMDDLAPGENIFELRLLGVDIDKAVVGEDNPATFMTVDFFEHETQATAVHSGLNVTSDHTLQYVVKTDDFFLEYLDTRHLPVELNKSMGLDFAAIGVAHVNLRRVLDDAQTGHTSKSPPIHFCDVIGRSGEIIARLRYSAFMRRGIIAAVRAYRQLPAPRPPPGVDAADPIAVAHAAAAGAPGASSLIKIELSCCRELVPRAGSASTLVPYCTYQFPGLASHDTTYGRGANPEFHDAHEFPLARTAALERRLERAALEVIAFDDADMDLEGAGVIGIARVDLEPLSKGLPVQGAFPLFSQTREKRGTVYISIAWKDPLHDDAAHMAKFELPPPASGPARVSAAPSAVVRGGGRDMEEDTGFGLSAEFHGGHGGRKPTPTSPTSISIGGTHTQLGARGQQRYGAVDDSIDAPGWQQPQQSAVGALAAAASALEGSADKIVVSIGQLELGSTLYHDHRVRQMFMLFELLPKFHRDDEQQTMRVKKESHIMDFAYTRVFSVRDAGLRTALASLLRAKNEEEASVPFCLVSDDNGIDFEDIGFFELNLHDVYEKGDFLDRRVEVLDKNDVCIGTVTISVVAQTALRSIMSSA
jgi:Ca2+-binding EF-hand superfamily protein